MQMLTTFFLFVGANSWPHSILTNSYTGVLFFSNDTKRNCLYLTKGASFHCISRPDRDNFLCSWAKNSALTVPSLHSGEYKWVTAYCLGSLLKCWGVTLRWKSIIQGVEVILLLALFSLRKQK